MLFLGLFLTLTAYGLSSAAEEGAFVWGYHGASGPAFWGDHFSDCNERRQSPIDIPFRVTHNTSLEAFSFHGYDSPAVNLSILNNGHTVQVTIVNPGTARISGGGLDGDYVAAQLHYHWGSTDEQGGEHTFRGISYPLELHIVHYKASYGSLAAAAQEPDGLAVLGFWYTIGEANPGLDPLISAFRGVRNKDDIQPLDMTFMSLMPAERDLYYRYLGSLTTPGCNEAVIWTVFNGKAHLSSEQMEAFRNLYENAADQNPVPLVDNFRPPQKLYSRTVTQNYAKVEEAFSWGYTGQEAPRYWKAYYETCTGNSQSPIDLQDSVAKYDPDFEFLNPHNYSNNMTMYLKNNGHTIQIDVESDHYLSDGGLSDRYKVLQAHFHWGSSSGMGSEHTRNGGAYPMEIHVVHYKERYGTLTDALTYSDGLAVLGAFFKVTPDENPKLAPLISKLPDVQYKGARVVVSGFSLADLTFPDLEVHPFFRYMGSLTTPPCSEVVIWTVLMGNIEISESQLAEFRKVFENTEASAERHYIVNNYRPVQSLNTREVYTNVNLDMTATASAPPKSLLLLTVLALLAALTATRPL